MAKVRQDAWSHEDDLLLAETVLRHIREGSTQLNAFEEVGDALNRTSAACGFRWNAEVRNQYINAIDLAKRQRKEKKRAQASQMTVKPKPKMARSEPIPQDSSLVMEQSTELTFDHVIHFLQSIQENYYAANHSKEKVEKLQLKNNELEAEINKLEQELNVTRKKLSTVEEDYKVFIQIMDRARKMTVLEEQGNSYKSPTFKMDKNGNLEQYAHGSN